MHYIMCTCELHVYSLIYYPVHCTNMICITMHNNFVLLWDPCMLYVVYFIFHFCFLFSHCLRCIAAAGADVAAVMPSFLSLLPCSLPFSQIVLLLLMLLDCCCCRPPPFLLLLLLLCFFLLK